MHAATEMARRRVAHQLPALLVWPYDCTRRCNELVTVPTGPNVAEEMTRNLREPFRSRLREQWS